MKMTPVLFAVLIFIDSVATESCTVDSDCSGYNPYDGIRCTSGECVCSEANACEDYAKSYCSKHDDCVGYGVYPGISCRPILKRCKCNTETACQGTSGTSSSTQTIVAGSAESAESTTTQTESTTSQTESTTKQTESTASQTSAALLAESANSQEKIATQQPEPGSADSTESTSSQTEISTQLSNNCVLNIQCTGSCSDILNPQEELRLTVDIGCTAEIKVIHLRVRSCPTKLAESCSEAERMADISTQNSVKYKPEPEDLAWQYHGLFVFVSLANGDLNGNVIVEFGPVPVAGVCSIAPLTGYALTTPYNLTCTAFSVADDYQLKYSIFTHYEEDFKKASKVYTGLSPNRFNMLLQPGQKANNFTVYIWVKAFIYYGAFVTVSTETQVYPPSYAGDVNVLDLAESFVSVEAGQSSSVIEDLITAGNTDEASQLLGVITATLNINTENETKSETDISKRKDVRTAIVTVLTEIPVTDIEAVSSTISILNEATEVTDEVSQEAQDVATDLYSSLAEGFDEFIGQQSTTEALDTAGSILDGVTRILDLNTDTGVKEMNDTETTHPEDVGKTSKKGKVEKARNSTVKLLKTIDTVSNTMMQRQPIGANTTLLVTDTMTVGIQKMSKHGLSSASYTAAGADDSTGSFRFSDLGQKLSGGQNYGVKMLYIKKNPYVWSVSAQDVTAPVIAVSLKNENSTAVAIDDLADPVAISLTNYGPEGFSVNTFKVALQQNEGNSSEGSAGNITFATSKPNMLSFNVTAVAERIITLNIVPVSNVTSFKMLIKTDQRPTFDEIITDGFLYPEEIDYSQFAEFKYQKTMYKPVSSDAKRTIYLTPNSTLSRSNYTGVYYIGLTLDLNHTQTLETLRQDSPECLGNNETACAEIVKVTIDIQTKQLGCIYWEENNQTWSSQGCEVSPYTTRDTIECLCTHLTSFSGSILVLPNMVDPLDFELFLTFFDNPVVVTAVIIVWVVYFFIIHWARQADKKDLEKVGVINCLDNSPTHNYIYLVCTVTGWWKDAGTTANVFIYLKGSKGTSSTHCLSTVARLCFQTGSEDWFLVTTEQSLGSLQEVTLWHDNMGASPHWYLNQVYVKDIQLHKCWHFIYNDWLAVNRGALLQTSATLEAVTEEELKFKQKHNFMVKSTQDLRDGHLWLSIFSKPAKSTFTRVQRLSCALSLLLTTMLTNIMFYGIPTDDPEDQVGEAGGIAISLSAIVIGIESSLIMFPVNLIILQLFLKVKPKPQTHEINTSSKTYRSLQTMYDVGSRLTDSLMDRLMEKFTNPEGGSENQASEPDLIADEKKVESIVTKETLSSGTLSKSSFTTANRDLSTLSVKSDTVKEHGSSSDIRPKSSKILPWWFLYIAWFLVISTSLISSYFVMLYGLKYGYNKSVSWLVSFLTGFTQSAFVTQPLKVICIAVIITLIFKKPAEFDDFGPDAELDEDEIYLHEVVGAEEIHHPTVQPLSKSLLQKIRQRLYVEWLMDMTLLDILLYVIYLASVTFMVHAHRDVKLAYKNNVAIEDVLVNPGCIKLYQCFFLEKADTVERMYQYFEDVLIPSLADMSEADHDYATPGSSHFLLGPFRLRQQRIHTGTCHRATNSLFKRFGQSMPECVSSYWLGDEDTGTYNNSWKKPLPDSSSDGGRWSHQSMWKLKTVPYSGVHATYSGGGFVLEMPKSADQVALLNTLKSTDWIDDRTRAIFAEFTLYNPNADLFSVVMIFFEFTNLGAIYPNHQIFTTKLYHYSTDLGPYVALCEVLFLLFNISFTYIEVKRYKKLGRREYFQDIWSYAEIIQLLLSYTVIGLFFQRLVSAGSIMDQYRASNGQTFVSFYTAVAWDFLLTYVMAFQVAFVTLKSVKLLRFNKRMFMISDTVTFAKSNLLSFAFMFVVFMIAFGHFTSHAFGSILYGYKNFVTSIFTMLNFALGASDLPGMYEANRILGPIYFAVFVFFSQWCFLTIFVAILNFGINDSKSMLEDRRNKYELVDYVVRKMKSVM